MSVLKRLIISRCNVDLKSNDGSTPLHSAAKGLPHLCKGHTSVTEQLIKAGCSVDIQMNNGCTPLHIAAYLGHDSITQLLIAGCCEVDLQDENGCTPLISSVQIGHVAVTKQLLAARCNVDLQAKDGRTALQVAERNGHTELSTLIHNKNHGTLLLGRRVVVNGLVAKPELNGRTGTAMRFDYDKGRYSVELNESSSTLMIKPCNLLPVVRCVAL